MIKIKFIDSTPQPISEIRHIINNIAAGTQTQPLGIANMEEIKTLNNKTKIHLMSFDYHLRNETYIFIS